MQAAACTAQHQSALSLNLSCNAAYFATHQCLLQAALDNLAFQLVQGLFAAPQHPTKRKASDRVLELFKLLGRAMAKALQDGRLLDLPLSYVFYRC